MFYSPVGGIVCYPDRMKYLIFLSALLTATVSAYEQCAKVIGMSPSTERPAAVEASEALAMMAG